METRGHSAVSGGLRGHSIGTSYPFSVIARVEDGATVWQVVNYETGEEFTTFRGSQACDVAHSHAQYLKDTEE